MISHHYGQHGTPRPSLEFARPSLVLVGLQMRTFTAKTLMCVVLTMMSLKVIYGGFSEMEISTNPYFKLLGCIVSFVLLVPSLFDAVVMGTMFMSLKEDLSRAKFLETVELGWESEQSQFVRKFCFYLFCCPCALFKNGWDSKITATIVACVDIIQTLVLFPLTVVVIFSSESELDIFVNMIAVHVFGNLDVFAKSITDRRGEMWRLTNQLYIDWDEEGKTPDNVVEPVGQL